MSPRRHLDVRLATQSGPPGIVLSAVRGGLNRCMIIGKVCFSTVWKLNFTRGMYAVFFVKLILVTSTTCDTSVYKSLKDIHADNRRHAETAFSNIDEANTGSVKG